MDAVYPHKKRQTKARQKHSNADIRNSAAELEFLKVAGITAELYGWIAKKAML